MSLLPLLKQDPVLGVPAQFCESDGVILGDSCGHGPVSCLRVFMGDSHRRHYCSGWWLMFKMEGHINFT